MREPRPRKKGGGPSDLSDYRSSDVPRGSAVDRTSKALREAILDGVLEPGEWLREQSLAAALGVSRTPLREAMSRLAEEGLITRDSGTGARVTSLTAEDMSVIYQVRGSLESLAASIAATRATPEQRNQLRDLNDRLGVAVAQGDTASFNSVNLEFHSALAAAGTNSYLRRLLGTVESAVRRFGSRSYSMRRMTEILAEHEAIVVAIEHSDSHAAGLAAENHAQRARAATFSRLQGSDD